MSAALDLRTEGGPAVRKMLDSFSGRELQNRSRRGVRAAGKVFRTEMRSEAASRSDLPKSFRKTKTRTSASLRRGGDIAVIVRPKSPLFNIFEPGAGSHTIEPGIRGRNSSRPSRPTGTAGRLNYNVRRAGGPVLGGKAGDGNKNGARWRKGKFFSRSAVTHPGMAARPLLAPVFSAGKGQAMRAATTALFADTGITFELGDD